MMKKVFDFCDRNGIEILSREDGDDDRLVLNISKDGICSNVFISCAKLAEPGIDHAGEIINIIIRELKLKGDNEMGTLNDVEDYYPGGYLKTLSQEPTAPTNIINDIDEYKTLGKDSKAAEGIINGLGYTKIGPGGLPLLYNHDKDTFINADQIKGMKVGQGEMKVTEHGALRESNAGRGRFDLLPYEALEALAKWYEAGAKKYEERNWEKGISVKDCINRMIRHALKAGNGWTDEDHLAAVMWNAAAAITMMQRKPECNDHVWHGLEAKKPSEGDALQTPEEVGKTCDGCVWNIDGCNYGKSCYPNKEGYLTGYDDESDKDEEPSEEGDLQPVHNAILERDNKLSGAEFNVHRCITRNEVEVKTGSSCSSGCNMACPYDKAKTGTTHTILSDDDIAFLIMALQSGGINDVETLSGWLNRRAGYDEVKVENWKHFDGKLSKTCDGCLHNKEICTSARLCIKDENGYYTGYIVNVKGE